MRRDINLFATIFIAMSLSCSCIASPSLSKSDLLQRDKVILQKMGVNIMDGGIRIKPAYSLMSNTKDTFYVAKIKSYVAMHDEQMKNGYVNEPESRATELSNMNKSAQKQYVQYANVRSSLSTHIRHDVQELKMGYPFIGVPEVEMDKLIGVAPYGAYKQKKFGDDADGWDGAVQFFKKDSIGICEFKEHNLKLAHGGVELVKELVSTEVNGKPTIVLIKGTTETGFLYTVRWYDPTFTRELSCSTDYYSSVIKQNVLELSKKIDFAQA